jgi:hypothetical protein
VAATLAGDLLGLAGSLFMAAYMTGGAFRGRLSILAWMAPVHLGASLASGVLALAGGGVGAGGGATGLLGWLPLDGDALGRFAPVLGAACTASLTAHTLVNWLTDGRLPTFIVSLILTLQPIFGNAWGLIFGAQPSPSALIAAPIIVAGAYLATAGARERRLTLFQVLTCRLAQPPPPPAKA